MSGVFDPLGHMICHCVSVKVTPNNEGAAQVSKCHPPTKDPVPAEAGNGRWPLHVHQPDSPLGQHIISLSGTTSICFLHYGFELHQCLLMWSGTRSGVTTLSAFSTLKCRGHVNQLRQSGQQNSQWVRAPPHKGVHPAGDHP